MDVLANMLNGLLTAGRAGKETITLPYSKFKAAIAKKLFEKEFISSFEKRDNNDKKPLLVIGIRYTDNKKNRINGIKRLSKLSRRTYFGAKDVYSVKQGSGSLILSTPKGILTGKEAKTELVGGEALFEIW